MAGWIAKALMRVHECAVDRRIRLTAKADQELAALGLDPEDLRDVLMTLRPADSAGRRISAVTGEWMYVFKPRIGGEFIYVKLVLRTMCVVVSFHEDDNTVGHEDG